MKEKQKITYLKVFENTGQHGAYKTLSIKTDRYRDEYISMKFNPDLKVGDEIEIAVERYAKKNGTQGLKAVSDTVNLTDRVSNLEHRLDKIEKHLKDGITKANDIERIGVPYPTEPKGQPDFDKYYPEGQKHNNLIQRGDLGRDDANLDQLDEPTPEELNEILTF